MNQSLNETKVPGDGPLKNYTLRGFVAPQGTSLRQHLNPSNSAEVISLITSGTGADVDDAVSGAAEASHRWRSLPAPQRADHLFSWAATITANAERLATAVMSEVGKPISEARGEVARCSAILRYYAGEAVHPFGEVIPAQTAGALQYTRKDPLGVVALITPWNFPLAIPLWKAAPALAFGNTVVLKPSEYSSLCATLLAETAAAAGIPPGVFSVVHGEGTTVGEALLHHGLVDGISFTGSTGAGARVAEVASRRNIRYQTEMGGKNVAIVLRGADLERAANLVAGGAVRYAGQKCTATSRVIVDEEIAGDFNVLLREKVGALKIGPVTDPSCAVGPLIHRAARDRVAAALAAAGDAEVWGGHVEQAGDASAGNFLTPAIVTGASPDSAIAQEELFGPVITSFTARTAEDAITIANNSRYGLSASLFTSDLGAALRYVDQIRAGMVRVNGDTTGVDPHAPFGGLKSSSSGSREQGRAAREFYTAVRTIQINP